MHKSLDRSIAAAELLLIAPAALFMTALFVRNLTPQQNEPARTAQRVVMLYASSVHVGLWVMLIGLPLVVFAIGAATLLARWTEDASATFLIAVTTVVSGGILAAVAVHVMTD
ncbi:MAG TPA: hypothetical protein VGJ82_11060 [Thermoanaerobaculia bacterium]|jgi:hypothetical protein